MYPKAFDLPNYISAGRASAFAVLVLFLSLAAQAQKFDDGYHRLTTKWIGEGRSLDVISERPQLADSGSMTGQFWKVTPVSGGYYRLTTKFLGEEKSLEVANDEARTTLQFAETANVTGQAWKITAAAGGFYRITNRWVGDDYSLDLANDGKNSTVRLAPTADISGQYWKIASLSPAKTPAAGKTSFRDYKKIVSSGFTIRIDPDTADSDDGRRLLGNLEIRLEDITTRLTAKQLEKLRTVPLWIEIKQRHDGSMWFHASKEWVVSNGYPAEITKSVEIMSVRNYLDHMDEHEFGLLHEYSHAWQDMFIPELQAELVDAYEAAKASGKYDKVEYFKGGLKKAYALTDKTEYFAELSEAYLAKNDYFPFEHDELKKHDPAGYRLMQKAWGPR